MFFTRKNVSTKIETPKADPAEITPETAGDYLKRGYAYYARQAFPAAQADFEKAIQMAGDLAEAYYGLGLAYKAQDKMDAAIEAFRKGLSAIHAAEGEDPVRVHMLSRLMKGHINQLTTGQWGLHDDFWSAAA